MEIGKAFRLIGRTTRFYVTSTFRHRVGCLCVVGVTGDGRYRTVARLADVLPL